VNAPAVLRVRDLRVRYYTPRGTVKAVEDVSFTLCQGEKLGLVGESGSGKSTIALALMRLIRQPGRIEGGEVLLGDANLLALSDERMRLTRFARISLVPQGAMNSLNPVMRIKYQIGDTIRAHDAKMAGRDIDMRIAELMEWVGLRKHVANMYPHELSGGMKQRVCIAMGICLKPQVIIADEPTSALDVVVQRQVMETLDAVQAQLGAAVILVGHDMGLMAQFVDRVAVMYAGRLVELGPVEQIFDDSLHPYTQLLIATLPSLEVRSAFRGIPGIAASPLDPPPGCTFHPRCPVAVDRCFNDVPAYRNARPGRWAACHLVQ
jgi:oligopeptide/dipeptide ABC transporter ATP-binding protein